MANCIWFEPRACKVYKTAPERRNVYRLKDTKENRKQLSNLIGTPNLIAFLEKQEQESDCV